MTTCILFYFMQSQSNLCRVDYEIIAIGDPLLISHALAIALFDQVHLHSFRFKTKQYKPIISPQLRMLSFSVIRSFFPIVENHRDFTPDTRLVRGIVRTERCINYKSATRLQIFITTNFAEAIRWICDLYAIEQKSASLFIIYIWGTKTHHSAPSALIYLWLSHYAINTTFWHRGHS